MDNQALQEIILLSNFEMDSKNPFILILTGQPVLKERLKQAVHEPLNQRISLRYHMSGMDIEETEVYINHQLKTAGSVEPIFEKTAFKTINQMTFGLPRKIGNLCLAAMTLAMIEKKQSITSEMVLKSAKGV